MTSVEASGRQRDALPSINHLDFDKYRLDSADHSRYSMPGLASLARITMTSPPTTYSGPPPPYSAGVSTTQSTTGYISPAESNSRRSTRDEKESPKGRNSLPSISEALKSTEIPATTQQYTPRSAPGSAVAQTFADAPKGPGNPFSQPVAPASALRTSFSSVTDTSPIKPVPPQSAPTDPRQPPLSGSPRSSLSGHRLSGPLPPANTSLESPFRSSYSTDSSRPGYPFPDHSSSSLQPSSTNLHLEHHTKFEDPRNPFTKSEARPYNETVKRHLDVYDAEFSLNEVRDISKHTTDLAGLWSQRYHQLNRASYYTEGLPNPVEIDDMIQNIHKVLENLSRLREVSVMQQNAFHEQQRARMAQGQHVEDDFHRLSDEYKAGGFAGGDAKKRRGKAAPPGRCHSCNRAETPEWRRGPDGARTLCNACGLHYAKLTRKVGANKAAVLTGSNLRPKNLSETRP